MNIAPKQNLHSHLKTKNQKKMNKAVSTVPVWQFLLMAFVIGIAAGITVQFLVDRKAVTKKDDKGNSVTLQKAQVMGFPSYEEK